jgi:hypothetical protein
MFIMLKEQATHSGHRYGNNDGRPCAVNVNNIADMREVELTVLHYPNESGDPRGSGTPTQEKITCVAIMFTFSIGEDACVFYYKHTLDEVLTIIHQTHMRFHEELER